MQSLTAGKPRNVVRLAVFALATLAPVAGSYAASVQFAVTYADGAGEGFNDPTVGAARQTAFAYALNQWSQVLNTSYAGETINVTAQFNPLGGTATSATLGSASPASFYGLTIGSSGDYWVPAALTNHLIGAQSHTAYDTGTTIVATFNSDVDNNVVLGNTNFYYGTDGNAGTNADFASVALHEIGHGLGFASALRASTGEYDINSDSTVDLPTIYDFYLGYAPGDVATPLRSLTPAQRMAAITSNNVYWLGGDASDQNFGLSPKIYAPTTYVAGSSLSHLDETVHMFDLMSPQYSGVTHTPSNIDRGMLSDILWDVNYIPEPASIAAMSLIALGLLRRRRA